MYYRCANIREEVVTEAATIQRTAFQSVYEIAAFSDAMSDKHGERLSAKKIAKLYADHVVQSKASSGSVGKAEVRGERMIDDALTIARRGRVCQCQRLRLCCEDVTTFGAISHLSIVWQRSVV